MPGIAFLLGPGHALLGADARQEYIQWLDDQDMRVLQAPHGGSKTFRSLLDTK